MLHDKTSLPYEYSFSLLLLSGENLILYYRKTKTRAFTIAHGAIIKLSLK